MTEPPHAAQGQFLALVQALRPELHRYCARMTGSVIEGEDVLQEVLAHAYGELSQLRELPALRAWLFRIAHNRALNYLAARARQGARSTLDDAADKPDEGPTPESAIELAQRVDHAVALFLVLPPAQRACVVLKDVLDFSLEEIADALGLSLPAVKAALHRGRAGLAEVRVAPEPAAVHAHSAAFLRYVQLFNRRDWEGVRALLAEDVKLELIAREQRRGRALVGSYFSNYDSLSDWHLVPGWLDGEEVIVVRNAGAGYIVRLTFAAERVLAIHDYRYVRYVMEDAALELG